MGVNRMLTQQVEGLETLKALLNTDPKGIAAAHEEARKQLALTEAEQARVDEARAFIAKHAQLSADLMAREKALADAKAAHENNVASFQAQSIAENNRLSAWDKDLKGIATAQIETSNLVVQGKADLEKSRSDLNAKYSAAFNEVKKMKDDADAQQAVNTNEAARLARLAQELKEKSAAIRQNLAEF